VMASACWGDSCVLVPWAEYLARGDTGLLRAQYPVIAAFLRAALWWSGLFSVTPTGRHVWRFPFHFGDWCAPDGTAKDWVAKGKWVATAYLANSCALAARIAGLLGRDDDARRYETVRRRVVAAYRKAFTDGAGTLKEEFQTAYVLPLAFGMTEGTETAVMADNLVRLIRDAGGHLGTGFPGTPYLLFALSDHGHLDAAYDLLLQDTCPSWLYEVATGGTTIWERWDALRPDGTVNTADLTHPGDDTGGGMVSFNHYAGGAVGDWLYRRVAGLEATSGGYKTFLVAPRPGGGLTWARATHESPYGEICSAWTLADGTFALDVVVPCSTTATIRLPNGDECVVPSGRYRYEVPYAG